MLELMQRIWSDAVTATAPPSVTVSALCAAVALIAVVWRPLWGLTRHALTICHEAGHGLIAVLTGRRLAGIRLHSDTSGLTLSVGRPRGLGMIATAAAGYPAPAAVGLGAAALLSGGYALGLLWLLVLALIILLVQIRNWFGLWAVLVCGATLVAVSWWAPPEAASAVATVITVFLLLGAPRAVMELQHTRRRSRPRTSDADLLANLTPLPGLFWIGVFMVVTLGCAALGGLWLLDAVRASG